MYTNVYVNVVHVNVVIQTRTYNQTLTLTTFGIFGSLSSSFLIVGLGHTTPQAKRDLNLKHTQNRLVLE